jgi:S1-C subfamily serine protease
MSGRVLLLASLAGAMTVGQAWAAESTRTNSVGLTRLMQKFPLGRELMTMQNGPFCIAVDRVKSTGALTEAPMQQYGPVFESIFKPDGSSEQKINLFDRPKDSSDFDFQIAGLIHEAKVVLCTQGILGTKFSSSMEIQWQIYSAVHRKVVATIETTGSAEYRDGAVSAEQLDGQAGDALKRAFSANVKQLSEAAELKAVLSAPVSNSDANSARPAGQARIALLASIGDSRSLEDATGSVVLVGLSDSFGSGVLVSEDGYILTNQHVVGGAKTVTVRWSDGFETAGEVVRVHKDRDVALVKTDSRGRSPLPIRTSGVAVGEPVTAIGSPLDKTLQGTVTRGIVSARRVMDGYSFIQSDVAITHGNSGGPLLDAKGSIVALADAILAPQDIQIGLNLFIPIKDALDFLSLDITPEAGVAALH